MIDTTHVPGLALGGFLIPGGNGLPDLYVGAHDPAGWVQMQIAARNPDTATSTKDVATTAAVGAVSSSIPDWAQRLFDSWLKKLDPTEYIKGLAVGGVLLLVAIGLILLGAYKLTQD